MKKKYMQPEVQVFNVKVQNLLAGSLDVETQNGGTLNAPEFEDTSVLFDETSVLFDE